MLFSQGEDESQSFLGKCKFIYENLPAHLKVPTGTYSTTTMSFPSMDSKIVAFPSTENAGRSETATIVIQDEFAFHRYAEANLLAVKPTIDSGGQLIQVSTINKAALNGPFAATHRKSVRLPGEKGEGYAWRFYGWTVRPGRDQTWYDRTAAEAVDTDKISAKLYMQQEYPKTRDEMLRPSDVLSAFDVEALEAMRGDVRDPIETSGSGHIFQKWHVGGQYCAGADTSRGVGLDESVLVIMDARTGYVVADIWSAHIAHEDFGYECKTMLERYDSPVVGVELNEWGKVTVDALKRLGYSRVHEHKKGVPGWETNSKTRPLLWNGIMEAVKDRLITIPSRHGLAQFGDVIRNPDKNGRVEAQAGAHDDYPMAAAIAWQMREHVTVAKDAVVERVGPGLKQARVWNPGGRRRWH